MRVVEELAQFAVYQCRCRARAERWANADALLSQPTISGKCAPLSEIGRKVITLECLIERTTPGHLWSTYRPSKLNLASKKLSRHPIQGHACAVIGPG